MKSLLIVFCVLVSSIYASPPAEFDREQYNAGEQLFEKKCSSCHVKSMEMDTLLKNFISENNKLLNLKAPTGNQISFRLKQQIGSKEDIEFHIEETADFLVDYLYDPDKSKTVCLEGVIKHFDTMPSQKGKVSEDEIRTIGHFLYFIEGWNGVNKYYHNDDLEFKD